MGVRDAGLLDSALGRAINRATYDDSADAAAIAADYAFGIAKNHPFVDGNKRTAFVAMELCLVLNGIRLEADDKDAVTTMLALASGEIDAEALAAWIRARVVSAKG